ncbi:hypothetical protein J6C36_03755 [Methanocorpusculaceae archaeon]|nr:hypothetical protein [Methanocorpusculaceae archaeon]MBO5118638.1 hypothetical protein [Methanocorpusculum sp.]MBO5368602.1 hypothetical protein [Methanocorpusculum sp.]MBO5430673.1 hypothetical protein [Methanocorpusculum sp.]MBP3443107.1 hypothetical protein [Methanocorpusculaceae archaeon]
MFGVDGIPGFGKIIGIAERCVKVGETLVNNTDIMEQFKASGILKAGFSVYDYRVDFTVLDKRKNTIPAEVEITEEA